MKRTGLLGLIIIVVLASCAGPAATPETVVVKETVVVEGAAEVVEKEVTRVVEMEVTTVVETEVTATPEPEPVPAVGGTLIYALGTEPETLDAHLANTTGSIVVLDQIGGSLVAQDPATGEYVPYLAESWQVGADGMSLEFALRKDVTFHDGTPLTAQDWVYTFERALNPATGAGIAAISLTGVSTIEAVDDYTLRINMALPQAYLLDNLSNGAFLQPLSQEAVEQWGDEYGRHPVGVGPFKFKEWETGNKVVLERNPDFNWAPAYASGGAPYIETIEYRVIPEYATILAGLEAGQIDYSSINPKDVRRLQDTGQFELLYILMQGISPGLYFNNSRAPFDDVRVRQAFNMAVNRDTLIQVAALGEAIPQYGPITSAVKGYWPGVEYIGYHYDLNGAKALMAEAGYTLSDDGVLEKDGQPLALTLKVRSASFQQVKVAELIQEQLKELGVQIEIRQEEEGIMTAEMIGGDFEIAVFGDGWPNSGLLFVMYHSSMAGVLGTTQTQDPDLDRLIEAMGFTLDPEQNIEMGNQAQKYIVEKAYIAPLYTPKNYAALSTRVHGAVLSSITSNPIPKLFDAYIETTVP